MKKIGEDIIDVIVSIATTSCFICVFFFTLGGILEQMVLKKQLKNLVSSLLQPYTFLIPTTIKQSLLNIEVETNKEEDEKAAKFNSSLMSTAAAVIVFFVIFCSGLCLFVLKFYGISKETFFDIIKDNMVVLIFVGLTYAIFAFSAGLNYISADPNFVKRKLIESIQKRFS